MYLYGMFTVTINLRIFEHRNRIYFLLTSREHTLKWIQNSIYLRFLKTTGDVLNMHYPKSMEYEKL
jgi:hypothetical protein